MIIYIFTLIFYYPIYFEQALIRFELFQDRHVTLLPVPALRCN